jgi:hypothetical protein
MDVRRLPTSSRRVADRDIDLQKSSGCELLGVDVAAIALEADALYEVLMGGGPRQ